MNDVFKDLCSSMKGKKSVFNFLSDEDIKNLSTFFESKNIPAGETLWKEEDPCDYIAFIVSGRVEIKKETEYKGKNVIVGIYSKGALVLSFTYPFLVSAERTGYLFTAASFINAFISLTALSTPTSTAREMILCPM